MTDQDTKAFWDRQSSSLHRSDDQQFYERKAVEQVSLMTETERKAPCLDLGCGAGELIAHLRPHVNLVTGLDYSQSMLDAARQRLGDAPIRLLNADLFAYLPNCIEQTWMTTGAINQYLAHDEMLTFLTIFSNNTKARSLFLFDCVDPLRYAVLPFGSSYLPRSFGARSGLRALLWPAYLRLRQTIVAAELALGLKSRPCVKLRGDGMGYGYRPDQWRDWGKQLGLDCDIVSSLLYEYRYHVILRKV